NVPAKVRFKELASSADRLAGANFEFGERYVVVNLPSTSVEAVENGKVAHRYVAIVGDKDHPSPEISAHVQSVNLNPTWTVPVSIIKKEIIPRMQRDPGYLAREKIRILDASGAEVDPKRIDWSTERAVNYTLLEGTSGGPVGVWDKDSLLAEIKNGAREDIKLTRSTPVIWVYLTGWAGPDGGANFCNDVYGLDAAGDAA